MHNNALHRTAHKVRRPVKADVGIKSGALYEKNSLHHDSSYISGVSIRDIWFYRTDKGNARR
jgi:hypothetical protein